MKNLFRIASLMSLGGFVLWLMSRYGLIDFSLIAKAFLHGWEYVALISVALLIMYVLLMFRYVSVARAFGIRCSTREMMAATFVSVAVGQWAPGSLAVMEMIRLTLMFGADKKAGMQGAKAALVVASLYDRLIGFFVYLVMGFVGSIILLCYRLGLFSFFLSSSATDATAMNSGEGMLKVITALAIVSMAGASAILAMPFVARSPAVCRVWSGLGSILLKRAGASHFPWPFLASMHTSAEKLRSALSEGASKLFSFATPVMLTLVVGVTNYLAFFWSSKGMEHPIPFLAIVVLMPIMGLAQLLPLGFAGMGGYQLVTALLFGLLSADPKAAASANLLQNALGLAVSTLLGLWFIKVSYHQLVGVMRRSKEVPSPGGCG